MRSSLAVPVVSLTGEVVGGLFFLRRYRDAWHWEVLQTLAFVSEMIVPLIARGVCSGRLPRCWDLATAVTDRMTWPWPRSE